jgi:hypothetical protein
MVLNSNTMTLCKGLTLFCGLMMLVFKYATHFVPTTTHHHDDQDKRLSHPSLPLLEAIFPHIDIDIHQNHPSTYRKLAEKDEEEEEEEKDETQETGSFANCEPKHKVSRSNLKITSPHPESRLTTISCRDIHYRAPFDKIKNSQKRIVVGVLSGAAGKGPLHRDSVRATWASGHDGVYFIVAGPWEDIQEEYDKYRDLIWLDEAEVYEGEESVLPFKTEAFIDIVYRHATSGTLQYLFKTDDDSYVNLKALENELLNSGFDYWGCCTAQYFRPLRHPSRKWRITFDMYPEEFYPLYCQGAGFAMSKNFVSCMVDQNHLKQFRYNPFEDVSIGLLAERCGFQPSTNFDKIKQYRTREASELKQLVDSETERAEIKFLPRPTMKNKIVQHRVKTHFDMYTHHKCVLDNC